MAIVSSKQSKSGRAFLFFVCIALLLFNVIVVFFCFYTLRISAEYKTRFAIDEKRFQIVVREAVTNYFSKISLPQAAPVLTNSASGSKKEFNTVPVVSVVGSTWLSLRGEYRCVIDGLEYGTNDFTPYGLIVAISDGRIYVSNEGVIRILRLIDKPSPPLATERPARGVERGEDGYLVK